MDASDPDGDDTGRSSPGENTDVDADTAQRERDDTSDRSIDTGAGERGESGLSSDTGADERGDSGPSTDTGADERGDSGPSTDTGADERGESGLSTDTGAEDVPEPTPQSAALRRQQQYVGVGGALVAGVAFGVGTLQRFPDTPVLAALAGLTGTALVLWLVRKSIFPGERAA